MSSDAYKVGEIARILETASRELREYISHNSHIALYTAGRRMGEAREHIETLDDPNTYTLAQTLHRNLVWAHHDIIVNHATSRAK